MARGMLISLTTALLLGCGAQETVLETEGSYLFFGRDVLTTPASEARLEARLLAGDFLSARPGYVARFSRDGALYRSAETGPDGVASVTFTPKKPGDYLFEVQLSHKGFPQDPPPPAEVFVVCRTKETPLAIIDMDHTLVASGFEAVLIGDAKPMDGSAEVVKRLAEDHEIVYLTHRPDYFTRKSKSWLAEHGYPDGAVLLSELGQFVRGSGQFKSERIARLQRRFANVRLGIGDKFSDVLAYHERGLRAVMVFHPAEGKVPDLRAQARRLQELPEAIDVVRTWARVAEVVFEGKRYPPERMRKIVEQRADALEEARRKEQTPR